MSEGDVLLEDLGVSLVLEFEGGQRETVPLRLLLAAPITLKLLLPFVVDVRSPISVVVSLLNREVTEGEVDRG